MSIYALKPRFQALLRPLVRLLSKRGVTANQVTLLACAVSVGVGLFLCILLLRPAAGETRLWRGNVFFVLLPIWFFIRMALNAIDGMLAREFGQQSAFGGYLNELTDVVADAALYLPFVFVAPFLGLQIGLVIFLSTLSEFCGVLGQVHGNGRRYDGPVGKSDRAFIFGVLGLWLGVFGYLPAVMGGLMWLLVLALGWTCWRRVRRGLA